MSVIIRDCIYDSIEISGLCRKFLDIFEFQRLRNIRQLGFAYLVFPSAMHTRFEHSLGMVHLAGKIVDVLRKHGQYISDREKELIELAAMFYNCGHIAFSDFLDNIVEKRNGENTFMYRSIQLLYMLSERNELNGRELQMISKMINGNTNDENRPYLFQIVNNKSCGIDVRCLDYLQRDAHHIGLPKFNPCGLIENIRVQDGQISFSSKAKMEVELLRSTMAQMNNIVYNNKTVIEIENRVSAILLNSDFFDDWETIDWKKIDDSYFLTYLNNLDYDSIYQRNWLEKELTITPDMSECSDVDIYFDNVTFV